MEPIESAMAREKPVAVDRATLGKSEAEKVNAWIKQIKESSKGFLDLTRSDLINFLIRDHRDELTPKEIAQIRADNYNPIRHINWITQELKAALSQNDLKMVGLLQAEIKGIELSSVGNAQTTLSGGEIVAVPTKRKRTPKSEAAKSPEAPSVEGFRENSPSE
jgi:hypothetical protein